MHTEHSVRTTPNVLLQPPQCPCNLTVRRCCAAWLTSFKGTRLFFFYFFSFLFFILGDTSLRDVLSGI